MVLDPGFLQAVYARLFAVYGPQHWWPAESAFEVLVGAVLTQNTAWTNVEQAIVNLKTAALLSARAILTCPSATLAACIRSAGYFNIKARRLKNLCRFLEGSGGIARIKYWPTRRLRQRLLAVNGVGPETADDMLLYAFRRPVFVIDAYTRRLFTRLGMVAGDETYEQLRSGFETALGADVPLYNEFHALIVRHAKDVCTARHPACAVCCLRQICCYSED